MILDTIQGIPIYLTVNPVNGIECVSYTAGFEIDNDGINPAGDDPDHQNSTSLQKNGQSCNSLVDLGGVVPPQIIAKTKGIVMGSICIATYSGLSVMGVVYDEGEATRLGEGSVAFANALGIPSDPLTGGISSGVRWSILVGIACPGYTLQPSQVGLIKRT